MRFFYTLWYFPLPRAVSTYNKSSENVVIVYPNKWNNLLQYLYSDAITSDLALIKAVMNQMGNYRIKFGVKKMNTIQNSTVYFNMSNRFNVHGFRNYTKSVIQFIEQMELQRNITIPTQRDVSLWENKVLMHAEFDRLEIKTPETVIYDIDKDEQLPDMDLPYLIKEVHSKGAEGIYKITTREEALNIINNKGIVNRNSHLIFQRLLKIDRDVRVVCIGDQIAYHHWRFNEDIEKWEPTTYKKGRRGDFGNFPEQWRSHILSEFKKLDITTGGFDLTWENNDFSQSPYVLEVSPAYFPNPEPPENIDMPYGDYKHRLKFKHSWEKHFVRQVDRIKEMIVAEGLRRIDQNK